MTTNPCDNQPRSPLPGSHVSILLVGHSFIRRLVGYLDDQHIENFNLCDSYKVDFLASRTVSTMPNLWANFSDILVKSPDVVYAEICSNDIARGRDPISLADDVFQFANCLLAHGVTMKRYSYHRTAFAIGQDDQHSGQVTRTQLVRLATGNIRKRLHS